MFEICVYEIMKYVYMHVQFRTCFGLNYYGALARDLGVMIGVNSAPFRF
jgi:hypothetical protein